MTDTTDDAATPAEEATARRLTAKQWAEITNLALNGKPASEIADLYKVHRSVIYRGLKNRGVKVGSMVEDARREEADKQLAKTVERIKETKEQTYTLTHFLERLNGRMVADAQRDGKPLDTVEPGLKAIGQALRNAKIAKDIKWSILGLDKENEHADAALPDLPIREMTLNEIEAVRARQVAEEGGVEDLAPPVLDDVEDEDLVIEGEV